MFNISYFVYVKTKLFQLHHITLGANNMMHQTQVQLNGKRAMI